MKKTFAEIAASRRRYNPATEGYGNPDEWKGAFRARMGLGEAKEVLQGQGPRAVLGVNDSATWDEIRRAYKKMALQHHPDRAEGAEAKALAHKKILEINAAYAILADEFGQN